jgi:protein TonB
MGAPSAPSEQTSMVAAPSVSNLPPDDAEFGTLEDAPSVPLSQAVTDRADRQPAARTERETRSEPTRQVEREQPRQQTPPPSTTTQVASNASGPVSLTSPSTTSPSTSGPVPLNPNQIPPSTQTSANVEPQIIRPQQPTVAAPAGTVVWTSRPSARRISDLYPSGALRSGTGGRVVLDCRVLSNLSVSCSVASETPAGEGFGRAALSASNSYRARATRSDGSSSIGTTTRIAVNFQAQ